MVQTLLDPIIIMLTISRRAEHFSKEVFDVTSQIIFQIKKNKDTEKSVIVLLTSFAHAGSSKRQVKYRLLALYAKLVSLMKTAHGALNPVALQCL